METEPLRRDVVAAPRAAQAGKELALSRTEHHLQNAKTQMCCNCSVSVTVPERRGFVNHTPDTQGQGCILCLLCKSFCVPSAVTPATLTALPRPARVS